MADLLVSSHIETIVKIFMTNLLNFYKIPAYSFALIQTRGGSNCFCYYNHCILIILSFNFLRASSTVLDKSVALYNSLI